MRSYRARICNSVTIHSDVGSYSHVSIYPFGVSVDFGVSVYTLSVSIYLFRVIRSTYVLLFFRFDCTNVVFLVVIETLFFSATTKLRFVVYVSAFFCRFSVVFGFCVVFWFLLCLLFLRVTNLWASVSLTSPGCLDDQLSAIRASGGYDKNDAYLHVPARFEKKEGNKFQNITKTTTQEKSSNVQMCCFDCMINNKWIE